MTEMFGLGTIINVVAIIVGGVMGLVFGKKLTERYQSNLMMASALCVLFIGVSGMHGADVKAHGERAFLLGIHDDDRLLCGGRAHR